MPCLLDRGDHLDSLTAQKLASRAFTAVKEYQFGKRGKPRFKRYGWMSSLEGKNNASGIKWRDGRVKWNGLDLRSVFDRKDKHGIQAHALSQPVKYCRLVRKVIRGNTRWFVQLVLSGAPKIKAKNVIGCEAVGLDIGPSTIAVVGDTDACLLEFCPEIDVRHKQKPLESRKKHDCGIGFKPSRFRSRRVFGTFVDDYWSQIAGSYVIGTLCYGIPYFQASQ